MAVMLITHAMGVVAETAQRVVVMYAGKVVEEAPVIELFGNPRHSYTQGLIRSIPRLDLAAMKRERLETTPARCRRCCAHHPNTASLYAAATRCRNAQRPSRRCARSSPSWSG
jgi:peptide/nickel transport system ATP-binding protein